MFGGYKNSIKIWHKLFYNTLDDFYKKGKFCGKDQTIMKEVVENYPNNVETIKPSNSTDWYHFIWYLNNQEEKPKNIFIIFLFILICIVIIFFII